MKLENNKVVSMYYILKDAKTGEILDQNTDSKPLSFILGKGHILEALESKLLGVEAPSKLELNISAEEGLGEYDEDALELLPKEQFAGIELTEGMELFGEGEDGSTVRVIVKSIADDTVRVDYNHPYAGLDLLFSLDILEARDASENELLTGVVEGASSCGCEEPKEHKHGGCGSGGCCGGH